MKKTSISLFPFLLQIAILISPLLIHAQTINTIAGNGLGAYTGDGGPATVASIHRPHGIYVDAGKNIYFSDFENNCIRKIDPSGVITTIAGTGVSGHTGDGGPATAATLYNPLDLFIDNTGNLIFTEYSNHTIRKITPSGIISTLCGNGIPGFSGDGGLATAAQLNFPCGICEDKAGNLYVCDANNNRVRKISTTGIISTFAGTGALGFAGDGGMAVSANLGNPYGIAIDTANNIYIVDQTNYRIRKINTAGVINTIAGTGIPAFSGDGGIALAADIYPTGIKVDKSGANIYIADRYNNCVRQISSGVITTIAGTGGVMGFSGDGGPATAAQCNNVPMIYVDGSVLYLSDCDNNRVRKICITPPAPDPVMVSPIVCTGSTTLATNSTPGGVWSISNSNASIGSTSGNITGITPGTATISYSITNDCGSNAATAIIRIDAIPSAGSITGSSAVCAGTSVTLSNSGTTGGTWSSDNTSIATVSGTGTLSGISVGTATISYSVTNTCGAAATAATVTVLPLPSGGVIAGPSSVCPFGSIALSATIPGGTWRSSSTAVATVSGSGSVSGLTAGTAVISYSVTNTCGTAVATTTITVDPLPSTGAITGILSLCEHFTTTLSDPVPGGVWSSSNTSIATVSSGSVFGTGTGTATISYSLTNACGTASATATVTVGALSVFGTITGPGAICKGSLITLADPLTGGSWSSSNPGIASVDAAGQVSGITSGTALISYTSLSSCGTSFNTFSITVDTPLTVAPVTGATAVCVYSAIVLSDATPGGAWSSDATSIAMVNTIGIATGVSAGSTFVSYTVTNSCGPVSAVVPVTFLAAATPAIVAIGTTLSTARKYLTYQWYSGTTPIPGETNATYLVKVVGTYSVRVTDITGCSGASTAIAFTTADFHTITGVTNATEDISDVNVFPNPNRGSFTIAITAGDNKTAQVIITNLLGQRVKEFNALTNTPAEVTLDQPAGIYIITIIAGSEQHMKKLIVQ